MKLDELLGREFTTSERVDRLVTELAQQVAATRKRNRRRGWITGIIAGGVIVTSAGGLTAAAASGVWPFTWVDGPDVTGNHEVTVSDGTTYSCPFELHLDADYTSASTYAQIQKGEQVARHYIHSIDVNKIKIDPKFFSPPGSYYKKGTLEPHYFMDAWSASIEQHLQEHMDSIGLPAPSLGMMSSKCVLTDQK